MENNQSLPDENQEKVLPEVKVGTGSPDMPEGKQVDVQKDEDSGTIPQEGTGYAVDGEPHYGEVNPSASKQHED